MRPLGTRSSSRCTTSASTTSLNTIRSTRTRSAARAAALLRPSSHDLNVGLRTVHRAQSRRPDARDRLDRLCQLRAGVQLDGGVSQPPRPPDTGRRVGAVPGRSDRLAAAAPEGAARGAIARSGWVGVQPTRRRGQCWRQECEHGARARRGRGLQNGDRSARDRLPRGAGPDRIGSRTGVIRVFTDARAPGVYIAESNRTLASYSLAGAVTAPACMMSSVPRNVRNRLNEDPWPPQTSLPSPVVPVTRSISDPTPVAPYEVTSTVSVPRSLPSC